jgi:Bifunctional DNA primase/polymerase, N-terminal
MPEENRTLGVKTWSDGRHYIYHLPKGLKLSSQNDAFADGIDLKTGSNAYLVGVGSTIDGKPYEWANARPIIELPLALIECLKERKKFKTAQKSAAAGERLVEEDDEAIGRAEEYLATKAPEAADGNRDDTAAKVARRFYDFGVSDATNEDLMRR